jgi:hypothetical protein
MHGEEIFCPSENLRACHIADYSLAFALVGLASIFSGSSLRSSKGYTFKSDR